MVRMAANDPRKLVCAPQPGLWCEPKIQRVPVPPPRHPELVEQAVENAANVVMTELFAPLSPQLPQMESTPTPTTRDGETITSTPGGASTVPSTAETQAPTQAVPVHGREENGTEPVPHPAPFGTAVDNPATTTVTATPTDAGDGMAEENTPTNREELGAAETGPHHLEIHQQPTEVDVDLLRRLHEQHRKIATPKVRASSWLKSKLA
eukprot:CAMPEP_0176405674 /NCGR_PEP_ID=MMETSP0127-20121128/463_1 /TAXON_ID=938130 /ORGANISM="Platyophrya macrostoma, Strain WH" /LENGTH=207 /DNA_ID=CAMNT_0017784747 /DNA_START=452 /DNA_END=1071 /DNA_ORIENTATION=-